MADFGDLHSRLNHTGNTDSHLFLKLEDVLERTIEAIGLEMRAACRIDELGGDPHAAGGLAH
jgi:hypothetical protein